MAIFGPTRDTQQEAIIYYQIEKPYNADVMWQRKPKTHTGHI
jgi:hypothetical protein